MRACSALQAYMSIPSEPVSARAQVQMVLTALLMLPVIYYLAVLLLPAHFRLEGVRLNEDGIQAEIHGTPFKAGGWRVLAVQAIPKCWAVWRSSTISKMAASKG